VRTNDIDDSNGNARGEVLLVRDAMTSAAGST
jgi:hypothetical protein